MVSKIVCLSLLAALASTANAFSWHMDIVVTPAATGAQFRIHPIDAQVPGNEVALVWAPLSANPAMPPFSQYGYGEMYPVAGPRDGTKSEVSAISVTENGKQTLFPCTKIEEFPYETVNVWKVYTCSHPDYYGKKGTPVPPPATTTPPAPTTSCPAVTVTVPVTPTTTTTTKPPKPTPTCIPGFLGKRNGKGPTGACCTHSDDCKDTCVKGKCGRHP